jgi:hypothetical protein
MTVATSTLAPPTALNLTQVSCKLKKTPEIEVDWAATSSGYVTPYSVERATSSNGCRGSDCRLPIHAGDLDLRAKHPKRYS